MLVQVDLFVTDLLFVQLRQKKKKLMHPGEILTKLMQLNAILLSYLTAYRPVMQAVMPASLAYRQ